MAGKTDGTYLFEDKTDDSTKKGFKNAKVFTLKYHAAIAEATQDSSSKTLTLVEQKINAADVKATSLGMTGIPGLTKGAAGTGGYKWTVTVTYTPGA